MDNNIVIGFRHGDGSELVVYAQLSEYGYIITHVIEYTPSGVELFPQDNEWIERYRGTSLTGISKW